MARHRLEKPLHGIVGQCHMRHLFSLPSETRLAHRQRARETARGSDDMDKLCKHRRRQAKASALASQLTNPPPNTPVLRVLRHFRSDEKAGVETVRHTRPSSISSCHSYRSPSGRNIGPRCDGWMLRMLCRFKVAILCFVSRTNRSNSPNGRSERRGTASPI